MSGFLLHGKEVPVAAGVVTWEGSKLSFFEPRARDTTTCVVVHWTGSENPPSQLVANMKARRVSVHFAIDAQGTIWQFLDAAARASHAQGCGANAYSVGIEVICRGSDLTAPNRGVVRGIRSDTIHGHPVSYAVITETQTTALLALVESLTTAFGLPMLVPRDKGDVLSSTLSAADARRFRGVVGHLHLDPQKVDPGIAVLRRIHQRGMERMGPGVA